MIKVLRSLIYHLLTFVIWNATYLLSCHKSVNVNSKKVQFVLKSVSIFIIHNKTKKSIIIHWIKEKIHNIERKLRDTPKLLESNMNCTLSKKETRYWIWMPIQKDIS